MGINVSCEDREGYVAAVGAHLYEAARQTDALPDVGIDPTLLNNPNLRPAGSQDPFDQLKKHVDAKAPAYLKELMGKLAAFTEEPAVTGLLTLVVSMVMETFYASSRRRAGGAGAELAERLRELIEEYLKRRRMHWCEAEKLLWDTRRLEAELSYLVTRMKGAALREMSSAALKHWANAAAFHCHMLVHLAHLEGGGTGAAHVAMATYDSDLVQELLPAYRCYKAGTVEVCELWAGQPGEDALCDAGVRGCRLRDRELGMDVRVWLPKEEEVPACGFLNGDACAQAYLQHMFSHHRPITDTQIYFTRMAERLPELIKQGGETLPALGTA